MMEEGNREMSEVSVIIPVYNAQKYLNKSIESVIHQIFSDWELLLIDDGSTDDSREICDAYAEQDSRIRVFSQKNSGPALAVYSGLKKASSRYVMFLDADDWYDKEMIEKLYEAVCEYNADGAMACYKKVDGDGNVLEKPLHAQDRHFIKEEIREKILIPFYEEDADIYRNWSAPRWNKIYRRDILLKACEDINMASSIGEDLEMNLSFLYYADSVMTVGNLYSYNYRVLNASLAHGYNASLEKKNQKLADSIAVLAEKQGFSFKAKSVMEDNNTLGLLHELIHTENLPAVQKARIFLHLTGKLHKKSKAARLVLYENFPGKDILLKIKNSLKK